MLFRSTEIMAGRILYNVEADLSYYNGKIRTTPGNIFFRLSAAQAALGLPPFKQSSKSNSGCRTGFENDTRAESTNVIVRTPQPYTYQCQLPLRLHR